MFLLPVRGLPPSGWWGRRRESRERDSKREADADRQHVTLPNWLANWRRDIKADRADAGGSTDGDRKWNCQVQQRSECSASLPPFLIRLFCMSLSLLLSPLPLPPLFHSLPACHLVCLLHLFVPQINPEIHKWQRAGTAKKRAVEGGEG